MNPLLWRRCATCGLTAIVVTMLGCQSLQMLNRGPAPSNDPFFSIQDRTPAKSHSMADRAPNHEEPLTNQSG